MRVIAGELRGRKLKAVPGKLTRPTSDKVKEAVFQMIGPYFQGGVCLDLFAGSGSLGIEAISRGMEHAVFIDKHPKAINTIRENIETMKIERQAEIFRADAFSALRVTAKKKSCFDLILIDPPYEGVDYGMLLKEIVKHKLLTENGVIYCEHDTAEKLRDLDSLKIIKQGNYGGTTGVTIYSSIEKKEIKKGES